MSLTPADIERHKRHILLKEIGGPGVQKLRAASVSIIGAGALGGPCALYLAAAGIGHIEIWDDDTVDRSNLQRQIQFGDADAGAGKANTLAARLRAIDPGLRSDGRTPVDRSRLHEATLAPYEPNLFLCFPRSDQSLHGVDATMDDRPRRLIQYSIMVV